MTGLLDSLRQVARDRSGAAAVSNESGQTDFASLLARVESLVPALRSAEPPLVILLALPGGPDFTVIQLAALEAGAVVVPVLATATPHEAAAVLGLIRPDLAVVESVEGGPAWVDAGSASPTVFCTAGEATSPGFRVAAAAGDGDALPEGTAMVQFTSGSSGAPKGILIGRSSIRAYLRDQQGFLAGYGGQQLFCPVPQSHSYGGTVVLEHLVHGTGVHVSNRFLPASDLRRMQAFRCRGLAAPPTYVRMLLQLGGLEEATLPDLAWINLGTAAPDPELIEDLQARRPDLTLVLRYGMTETFGYISRQVLRPGERLGQAGEVGPPIAGVELADGLPSTGSEPPADVRVRGEVVARDQLVGPRRVESTLDADGWLATGDLASVDAGGRLCLRGRRSSFLKRNGLRINPFEIEELLQAQDGVSEAVVVGVPDRLSGQRIVAVVIPDSGKPAPDPKKLLGACRIHLSAPKLPQECRLLARIPRTSSGKPDRPALATQVGEPPAE